MIEAVGDDDLLAGKVDRLDLASKEAHPLEHLAHGVDYSREIEIARRHFVQHGCEEKEVLAIDQRDFEVRATSQSLFQLHRGVQAGEAAAEDQDLLGSTVVHGLNP